MTVTGPAAVDKNKFGVEVSNHVLEIEKLLNRERPYIEEEGGRRFVKYELELGEFMEPPIQQAIKNIYTEVGWEEVEFPNSSTVLFIFPSINV